MDSLHESRNLKEDSSTHLILVTRILHPHTTLIIQWNSQPQTAKIV